jgi:hypothetical protein
MNSTRRSTTSRNEKTPTASLEASSSEASRDDINININNNISGDLLKEALEVEVTVETPIERNITQEQLKGIVSKVAETYRVPANIAYVGICCTLQAGGSNKNKRSNVKITIQSVPFESKKINEIITQQLKITPRQLARIIANDIHAIAVKHQITGNAYVSLKRFYPHLLTEATDQEKFWAADFQVDNPNCPDYIREALRKRYADKFISANKNKVK